MIAVSNGIGQMLGLPSLQLPAQAQGQQQQQQQARAHPVVAAAWAVANLQLSSPALWTELTSLAGEQLHQLSACRLCAAELGTGRARASSSRACCTHCSGRLARVSRPALT